MIIAIDFDDTLTADGELWTLFVQAAKHRGHQLYCVTARRGTEENIDEMNDWMDEHKCQMPIVFSNLTSKVDTMERLGIKVDIWIDDAPYALVHGRV